MKHLTIVGLSAFLRHHPLAKVLDVSFSHEREAHGHVPGNHHVPWYTLGLKRNPVFLGAVLQCCSPEDHVLLISRDGTRTHEAATLLELSGFKHIYNVLGGYREIAGLSASHKDTGGSVQSSPEKHSGGSGPE